MSPTPSAESHPPRAAPPAQPIDDYAPTRSSLVQKLRSWDDQASWHRFFETYWKLIYTVATRAGLSDFEAQEVVQETVIAVAKAVQTFKYERSKGKFRGWLTRWASWRIKDQFRKRSRMHEAIPQRSLGDYEEQANEIDAVPDPQDPMNQLWQEEWDCKLREVVMLRVRDLVSPKQFQIFDCYVVKGWPVSRVVETLGVSAASVYLARTRVSHVIKAQMARVEDGLI